VKVADAKEMEWMNADLICLVHCRGTGSVKLGINKLLLETMIDPPEE
jgi:hypothetical protein